MQVCVSLQKPNIRSKSKQVCVTLTCDSECQDISLRIFGLSSEASHQVDLIETQTNVELKKKSYKHLHICKWHPENKQ